MVISGGSAIRTKQGIWLFFIYDIYMLMVLRVVAMSAKGFAQTLFARYALRWFCHFSSFFFYVAVLRVEVMIIRMFMAKQSQWNTKRAWMCLTIVLEQTDKEQLFSKHNDH